MVRPASWSVIVPGVIAGTAFGFAAIRMEPPAPDVASKCATAVAVLLFVKVAAWMVEASKDFGREERLSAFVMFAAIVMSWLGIQQVIRERAFDHEVSAQKRELAVSASNLAHEIASFLEGRRQAAPPSPRPATWEQDDAAWSRFENQTTATYERQFGARVRAAHDRLLLRNMRDRDFDAFYRMPANEFQMGVVAQKLSVLAQRLAREDVH
jgi:hypothetical protein